MAKLFYFFKVFMQLLACLSASYLLSAQDRGVSNPNQTNGVAAYKNIYAVVIGISKYQDHEINLKFANKDAKLFADYLQSAYPGKLKLFDNLKLLLDTVANYDRIRQELAWLKESCKKGDLAIFYFAGHGGVQTTLDGIKAGYLLAYNAKKNNLGDGGTIPISELDNLINNRIATENGATTICILDACHAGTSRLFATSNEDINGKFNNEPQGNVIKFVSCYGSQSSKEEEKLCGGQGVFTYYLIKGLFNETGTDTGDVIRIRDVRHYLEEEVGAETNNTQTPNASTTNPDAVLKKWQSKNAVSQDLNCLLGNKRQQTAGPAVQRNNTQTETEYLTNKLSDIQKEHFRLFSTALAENRFIEPMKQSAIYYFKILEDDRVEKPILEQIKSQWKVKFQDHAQSLIVDYVNELHIAKYSDYENAAKMLDYCLSYSSKDEPGYNNLLSRKIWLECYSTNMKIRKGALKISQNEARSIRLELIEKLKQAMAIDSSAAYLRNTIGWLYESIGKNKEAENAYREAKRLAPRWTYPRNNLSNLLTKTEDKIAELDSCILLNPKMYLAYGNLAVKYMNLKKDLDKSEKYLNEAKKLCLENGEENDDIAWIYQLYGYLYRDRQMKKEAEEYFLKSISIYGDSAGSYRQALADFYSQFKEFDKAKKEIESAIRINPSNAELSASWGYRSLQMQHYDDAIAWYKKSIALDSFNSNYYYYIAYLYRWKSLYEINLAKKMELLDSANKAIDVAISMSPANSDDLAEKANVSLARRDTSTAVKYFEKCIEIDPQNSFIYYSMSFLYFETDIEKAKKLMLKAINTLMPNENADYYSNMGYLFYKQKEYQQALYYYNKALSINPKQTDFIVKVAITYSMLDKADSSVIYSNKAVENELATQNISSPDAIEYFKNKIRETNWNFYYYALGYSFEKGWANDKKKGNLNQAIKWYGYAAHLLYNPSVQKLIEIEKSGNAKNNELSAEIDRDAKIIKSSVKYYNMNCIFPDSSRRSISIYINNYPANPGQVVEEEINRVNDVYNAKIPNEAIEALNKLYKIAVNNKVSYVDLCAYALANASSGKSTGTVNNTVPANSDVVKDRSRESENYTDSQNDEVKIIYAIKQGQTQNLSSRMRILIEQQTGIHLNDFDRSYQTLMSKLKESREQQRPIYYYALGYLYENSTDRKDIAQARKWYGYAFQMGYSPAYFKLDSLYQYWSKSKLAWLKQNYEAEYYNITVPVVENANRYEIFLMEFPPDDANPIAHEADRLKDVFGVTIKSSSVSLLQNLYNVTASSRFPFVSYVEYYVYSNSKDTLNPDKKNIWYLYDMGNKSLKEKNYNDAIGFYKQALQVNPKNIIILNDLGIACSYNKNFDEGILYLKKMVEIDTRTASLAYYNIACNYALQNKPEDALKYLEESFKKGKKDFKKVEEDDDLNSIKNTDAFKMLIKKYSN